MKEIKSVGLIAEFNPFHYGHKIYIRNAKNIDPNATIICAMSPNFVQRGEVAIYPKYKRVKDALDNGVDLVVEIPTIYTIESADIYGKYALNILNQLKVDDIIFGTESGDTKTFLDKFDKKQFNNPRIDEIVEDLMDKGISYPKAKARAIKEVSDFYLENPNDILGYEYVKTTYENNYKFNINCYQRTHNNKSSSATKIRNNLSKKINLFYKYNFNKYYFKLLKYVLLTSSSKDLENIHLVEEGIQNLFIKNIKKVSNLADFIEICVSKRYSRARIKRTILHILLHTTKEEANTYLNMQTPYIRVLGFNKKGANYLKNLRKEDSLNIITRFSANDNPLLLNELKSTALYFANHSNKKLIKELHKEKNLYPIIKE